MDNLPAIILVGLGSGLAGRVSAGVISRRERDVTLDSDSFESRVSWAADFVALTGAALTGLAVTVDQLRNNSHSTLLLVVAVVCSAIAAGFLVYIILAQGLMNGYPESLYARILPRSARSFLVKIPFLLPGLLLAIVCQVLLVIVII